MRAVIAASVALAQQQLFLAPGANMQYMNSPAQVPVVYDEAQLEFAQPVVYAQPAAPSGLDLSFVLPAVAVLAVGAAAGYAAKAQREAALDAEEAAYEADLEAAYDAAQVLNLAGPNLQENRVAMLFSSGKKAAPKGKAAPKKVAPKKAAAPKKPAPKRVARPVAKKPAPKKPVAKKAPIRRSLAGPKLQPAGSAIPFLKELFSLSAVGGAKGDVLGIK